MTGEERRARILDELAKASGPLSGETLGRATGVSRQVIVQDVALLRAQGHGIVSTGRGYALAAPRPCRCERVLKCRHSVEETAEELTLVVDAGGTVEDVMVNHRVYGQVRAPLGIASRRDVRRFMDDIHTGKSRPLMTVTSGYHFHRISAPSEEVLDEIEAALRARGFLAEVLPYERDLQRPPAEGVAGTRDA